MASFKDLFEFSPALKLKLVTSGYEDIFLDLIKEINKYDGSLDIAQYTDKFIKLDLEGVSQNYQIENFSRPYKAVARDYESIILHNMMQVHKSPKKLIEFTYKALENSALIILLEKKSLQNEYELKELLDECEFRASNIIYDLVDDYNIIVAKKMHMWGNGL